VRPTLEVVERRPSPETGSPGSSSPEPSVPEAAAPAHAPERERTAPGVGEAGEAGAGEADRADDTPSGSVGRLVVAVLAYVGARLLVVAIIGGVLTLVGLPLLLSLLIAVIVALPLSLVLFRGLRARLAREADAATAERRERRERLRAELRGDPSPEA
jgi:hypothetical protein